MKDKLPYLVVLELCPFGCERGGQSCTGKFFVRFHPKRQHCADQQQSDAAEKGKRPISRLVDHISENQRRDYSSQRRAGIHQAACGTGKPRRNVHRDSPHGPNRELRKEEREAQKNGHPRKIVQQKNRQHRSHGADEPRDDEIPARFLAVACPVENPVAYDSAQRITQYPSKENAGREERRALQIKPVAVKKKRWYPSQIEPERPTIAKIDAGDGKHPTG